MHQRLFHACVYKIKMANCSQKECDDILLDIAEPLLKDEEIDENEIYSLVDKKISIYRKEYREWIDFFTIEFILAGLGDVLYTSLVSSNWMLDVTLGFLMCHLCLYFLIKGLFSVLSRGLSSVLRLVWIIIFFMLYMAILSLRSIFDQVLFVMPSAMFVLILGLLAFVFYMRFEKGNH